ncbi:MAG: amidohydrolase [Fluviicola sp.]|nr:MAG: amidohydrolase [Fluviicola sp.]
MIELVIFRDSKYTLDMKLNYLLILSFVLLLSSTANSQLPIPENGLKPSTPSAVVFRNAKIIVSPEETIQKGSMVIQDGRITAVGMLVRIPKGAIVIDLEGRTIVPAFIESYSSVGVPEPNKAKWEPRPQLDSKKEGAFYWNESIKPEVNAAEHFKVDAKASKQLQEMGFGIAITHVPDGIMRGTGAAVALGDLDNRRAIIKSESGAFFSFEKGNSRQTYPSSQMGSIALFRQAMLDAQYYIENKDCNPKNLSLEAINNQLDRPLIFKVKDKLEIFRAQKIAEEFNLGFTIFGSGNEYERINELQNWKNKLIIPIDFPEAYDVQDPYVSRQIPMSDLKNWELAPSNPYLLRKHNIDFALSSKGHKKADEFWKHLHKAMERGLSREDAIAALTKIPADIFQLSDELGTLEEGKLASFSIFDKDPFKYKDAEIQESWSIGKQHVLNAPAEVDIRGKFRITLADISYVISIDGTKEKPKGKVETFKTKIDSTTTPITTSIDTNNVKANISLEGSDASIHFNIDDDVYQGAMTLHGKFNNKVGAFLGQGQTPDGEWISWAGIRLEKHEEKKDEESNIIVSDTIQPSNPWFPNMAYGWDSLPEKQTYVLRNGTLWTNEAKGIVKKGTVIIKDGKIDFVGTGNFTIPAGAVEIDCEGMHITTGIIDEHSHIAISKGVNEGGQAVSAEVSIADVVRSDDINIYRQLSGGVTTSQLLHGSANPIGGQSAIIKLKWGYSPNEMLVDNSPKFIKFALGENVKQSNWGDFNRVRFPQTRMGVEQVFYDAFLRAKKYHEEWEEYNSLSEKQRKKKEVKAPARDLELEAVWEVMNSERFISCHSYVQSEINMLMHVADSMGFTVNTFTHILEGYKVADKMREHGAGGSTFSDWWAYKYEVNDAIPYNASLMNEQGVTVAINSDDAEMGRRLNQEAAKAIKYGGMTEEEAWKMVTLNPAKLLHLDDRMGSLKAGKDADIVIWSTNPLSINARVLRAFIDGEQLYDIETDEEKRVRLKEEKARIINAMLDSNKKGDPKKTFVKKQEKHWHCDTVGESAE